MTSSRNNDSFKLCSLQLFLCLFILMPDMNTILGVVARPQSAGVNLASSLDAIPVILPSAKNHNLPPADLASTDTNLDGTTPPPGAIIVRKDNKTNEYALIGDAVRAIEANYTKEKENITVILYVYPGTYDEHIVIKYKGPLKLMGYSRHRKLFHDNQVNITGALSSAMAGNSNVLSATLSVIKDNFAMYNINVFNTFGKQGNLSQALAYSGLGTKHGYYGCKFHGFQDTLLTFAGFQYFSHCYVEGAVDYIFTQKAVVWFEKATLASVAKGVITANGRLTNDSTSRYVFNRARVISKGAPPQSVCLGRPWGNFSRVAFQNSHLTDVVKPVGWCPWTKYEERTNQTTYEEYGNFGEGAVQGPMNHENRSELVVTVSPKPSTLGVPLSARAPFSHQMAKPYTIEEILGADYESWVDRKFRPSHTRLPRRPHHKSEPSSDSEAMSDFKVSFDTSFPTTHTSRRANSIAASLFEAGSFPSIKSIFDDFFASSAFIEKTPQ